MKTLPAHKCFKKTGLCVLIAVALMVATASETYAQTPTPTPTPVQRKTKILPPNPTSGAPYSG